jgi:hypothetical protein
MFQVLLAATLSLSTATAGTLDEDSQESLRALATIAASFDEHASFALEVELDNTTGASLRETCGGRETLEVAVYQAEDAPRETVWVPADLLLEGKRDIGTGAIIVQEGKRDIGTGAIIVQEGEVEVPRFETGRFDGPVTVYTEQVAADGWSFLASEDQVIAESPSGVVLVVERRDN